MNSSCQKAGQKHFLGKGVVFQGLLQEGNLSQTTFPSHTFSLCIRSLFKTFVLSRSGAQIPWADGGITKLRTDLLLLGEELQMEWVSLRPSVSRGQVSGLAEELAAVRALRATVGGLGRMNIAEQGVCPVVLLVRKVKAQLVQEMTWPEVIVA